MQPSISFQPHGPPYPSRTLPSDQTRLLNRPSPVTSLEFHSHCSPTYKSPSHFPRTGPNTYLSFKAQLSPPAL